MSKLQLVGGPFLALLGTVAALGCGGPGGRTGGEVDPYNGVLDNNFGAPAPGELAAVFQPFVPGGTSASARAPCYGVSRCYIPQSGFAGGKTIWFFLAGRISGIPPPYAPVTCAPSGMGCAYAPSITVRDPADGGGGWHADAFPPGCAPAPFDPVADAFRRDAQFPVVNSLPLDDSNLTNPHPPLGVVGVYPVTGVAGATCNDLKYAESIAQAAGSGAGKRGARRSAAASGYESWMIFDPTVAVFKVPGGTPGTPITPVPVVTPDSFWFRGLLGNYLSGGRIPTDAAGNLLAMDGVIVDPSSGFEVPGTNNAVLLPSQLGEEGYSPLVRLHDYHLKTGESLGSLKGVCPLGASCPSNYVKLSDATTAAFNTILIVPSPQ
jgi:hypothetical protein